MAECQIDVRNTTSVLSHTPLNARAINKKYYVLGSMLFRSLYSSSGSTKRICFSFLCASIFFKHASLKKYVYFILFAYHGPKIDLLADRHIFGNWLCSLFSMVSSKSLFMSKVQRQVYKHSF